MVEHGKLSRTIINFAVKLVTAFIAPVKMLCGESVVLVSRLIIISVLKICVLCGVCFSGIISFKSVKSNKERECSIN